MPAVTTIPKTVSMEEACDNLALSKGTSDGTAGTMYRHAVITNNGTHPCTMTGYPAVFMHEDAGMSVAVTSNALVLPAAVTLTPGGGGPCGSRPSERCKFCVWHDFMYRTDNKHASFIFAGACNTPRDCFRRECLLRVFGYRASARRINYNALRLFWYT